MESREKERYRFYVWFLSLSMISVMFFQVNACTRTRSSHCGVLLHGMDMPQCMLVPDSLLSLMSPAPWYGHATLCSPFLCLLALEFVAFGRGRLSCCDPLCASLFLNIDSFFLNRYWEWNC